MSKSLLKEPMKELKKALRESPLLKEYIVDVVKRRVKQEVLLFNNTRALMGEFDVFVVDMVTYIGAPQIAKHILGNLIHKYGASVMARTIREWAVKHL